MSNTDLTISETHNEEVTKVVVGDVLEGRGGRHLVCSDRALIVEVTEIEEACVLALGADDELVLLVRNVGD